MISSMRGGMITLGDGLRPEFRVFHCLMKQIGYHSRIVMEASGPEVRYSFGIYDRLKMWLSKNKLFNRSVKAKWFHEYHSIADYEKRLRQWGERRQNL